MSFFSDIGNAISGAVNSVGHAINDVGTSIDQTVRGIIPGGWAGVGAAALLAAGITDPDLLASADNGTLTSQALSNAGYDPTAIANSVSTNAADATATVVNPADGSVVGDATAGAGAGAVNAAGLSSADVSTINSTISSMSAAGNTPAEIAQALQTQGYTADQVISVTGQPDVVNAAYQSINAPTTAAATTPVNPAATAASGTTSAATAAVNSGIVSAEDATNITNAIQTMQAQNMTNAQIADALQAQGYTAAQVGAVTGDQAAVDAAYQSIAATPGEASATTTAAATPVVPANTGDTLVSAAGDGGTAPVYQANPVAASDVPVVGPAVTGTTLGLTDALSSVDLTSPAVLAAAATAAIPGASSAVNNLVNGVVGTLTGQHGSATSSDSGPGTTGPGGTPGLSSNPIFSNPIAPVGVNPGLMKAAPMYDTTSPVQAQYYWGTHPYVAVQGDVNNLNNVPTAPQTPWGLQQAGGPVDLTGLVNNIRAGNYYNTGAMPGAQGTGGQATTFAPQSTTTATKVAANPGAVSQQITAAWQSGDYPTVNRLVQENGITQQMATDMFNLTGGDINNATNAGITFYQPPALPSFASAPVAPASTSSSDSTVGGHP